MSNNMQPDRQLIDHLRNNFSHKNVADELLKIVKELCAAIGVEINTQIVSVNTKHKVDVKTVMAGIPRLSAVMGAVYAGSGINPFKVIEEHENVKQQAREQANRKAAPCDGCG